jgi:hypothetical protein
MQLAASSAADLNRRACQSVVLTPTLAPLKLQSLRACVRQVTFAVDGLQYRIFHTHLSYDRGLQHSQMQEVCARQYGVTDGAVGWDAVLVPFVSNGLCTSQLCVVYSRVVRCLHQPPPARCNV